MGKILLVGFMVMFLSTCEVGQVIYFYNPGAGKDVAEENALIKEWLGKKYNFVDLENLMNYKSKTNSVLWINIVDKQDLQRTKGNKQLLDKIRSIYDDGGKIILTNYASYLPYYIGIESKKPELRKVKIDDYWMFDKRGFQSYMGHPIFSGFFGGTYVFDSMKDTVIDIVGYFGDNFPSNGNVVSVDKLYIRIHEKDKLVIEYSNKNDGRILLFGGYILFANNFLRYRLEKLLENSFLYLAGKLDKGDQKITYWRKYEDISKKFAVKRSIPLNISDLDLGRVDYCGLKVETHGSNDYYDLTGRRILVMGREGGGIKEIWAHPFRPFYDVKIGIVDEEIRWLGESILPEKVVIRPELIERYYNVGGRLLKEKMFASYDKPGVTIQIESEGPLKLCLYSKSDFRFMWPYNYGALGGLEYGYDSLMNVLHIKSESGDFYSILGTSMNAVDLKVGAFNKLDIKDGKIKAIPVQENEVSFMGVYELQPDNEQLRVVLVGTNRGDKEAIEIYRCLMENAHTELEKQATHYRNLLARNLNVISPDTNFNKYWKWAVISTDKFFVETPGLGEGLLAGYGFSTSGWDGGHKVSGRPGYAWYFGRDSEWSSLAILGYGDFELVKKQLKFLQKYQDLSGKIFHEISTSGVIHYDAADATPLYVILCSEYLKRSGDVKFIKESWENIKKAMKFLYSTDFDDDGLIENRYVGHGWVEGGELWVTKTTFYLAALWAQVLKEASYMANIIGDYELSKKYEMDYVKVLEMVRNNFWNDSTRFYNQGIMADGTYLTESTSLTAVAMCFNLLEDEKTKNVLQQWAGHEFCTDWGMRMVSSESKIFNPRGYHCGSVWPLFTGWTALAEYEYGNSTQAFMKVYSTMRVKDYWAKGYVEEVLNGERFRPGGVCSHQCWSETSIIHPVVNGMVGWFPDVSLGEIKFKPRVPVIWDSLKIENLKAGSSVFSFSFTREKGRLIYKIKRVSGKKMEFLFQPEIPAGMKIIDITVNGSRVAHEDERVRKLLYPPLRFKVKDSVRVEMAVKGGVGIILDMPNPKPGDESRSLRLINEEFEDGKCSLLFQGRSGYEYRFYVRDFDSKVQAIGGADKLANVGSEYVRVVLKFEDKEQKFTCKKLTIHLE